MSATPKQDRLVSIDTLRGVAVLGILMMNIQAFAMIPEAYQYPPAHMDISGINATVWAIAHTFFSVKFITIFSALFGAGIVLMLGESDDTGRHTRRMLWLLLIGMIHAYIFWYGDILVSYAIFGLLAVGARKWSITKLTVIGLLAISLAGALMIGLFALIQLAPDLDDPVALGMTLSPEDLADKVATYQAGFVPHIMPNAIMALIGQLTGLILFGGRIFGVMLLGMALYKSGFLSASWSSMRYLIVAVPALVIGLGLSHWGSQEWLATDFAIARLWAVEGSNYVGSLFAALGYASVVMLICKAGIFGWLVHIFAATGRMAFTNYLTQTLIMTFIFVGAPGLGLYGTLERIEQVQLVAAVWLLQLIWSPLWLSRFRFGPLEWLWRSLTYGQFQPISKAKAA